MHVRTDVRAREQRGATLVEYALLVGVFAVGTLNALEIGATRTSESTAERISSREVPTVDTRPPGPTSPSTTAAPTTTTTTVAPTTTTTAAPPTTAPPTTAPPTTAAPTTTTTRPTTTTTAPATTMSASWGGAAASSSGNTWAAGATLTVTDNRGRPVSGAVVWVGVQFHQNGSWRTAADLTGTTSSSGTMDVDSGGYARTGNANSRVNEIRFTVKSVTSSGLSYTSGPISVAASRP